MNGRGKVFGGLVLFFGLILALAAVGALAYNAGLSQGATEALLVEGSETIKPYAYAPFGFHRFGPASLLLLCLVVPFIFFLFFGAMKLIFAPWRMGHHRRGGWGWYGSEEKQKRFEEMAAEWHRKAHEAEDVKQEDDTV